MLEHDERGDEPDAPELLDELAAYLDAAGVAARDEVALRRALERQVPGYDLFWLTLAGLDAL